MHRFVIAVGLAALMGGCAAVEMPDTEAEHPDWVEQRLAAGEARREAPESVPQRTLAPGEAEAMDAATRRLLERRDEVIAQAEAREERDQPSSASDFVVEGQDRTTPPQRD